MLISNCDGVIVIFVQSYTRTCRSEHCPELQVILYFQNIGSLINVHDKVEFLGNNAVGVDGGALFSTSLGQFKLFQGADINFKHNQGL